MKLTFDDIGTFNNFNHARARLGDKMGIIDFNGNFVVPFEYDAEEDCPIFDVFSETDTFLMRKNGYLGIINTKNEIFIPFEYDGINSFQMILDYIPVCKDKKWGIIDKNNNVIVDFVYDEIDVDWKDNNLNSREKTKVYYIARINGKPQIFNHLAKRVI